MIISASRRTDIPALYGEWFCWRLQEGFVLVRNPFNPRQVRRIALTPQDVDCFVFWSKNPGPFLSRLDALQQFRFYFHFTLTPYGREIEPNLPDKTELIDTFRILSTRIGRELVIWRYDPILLSTELNVAYHLHCFAQMARQLAGYTRTCVISFVDCYPKVRTRLRSLGLSTPTPAMIAELAGGLQKLASGLDIRLETCCEPADLSAFGIFPGRCIDDRLLSEILGCEIRVARDKNQRPLCQCAKSTDIGAYSTCTHGCLYCYATRSLVQAQSHRQRHDPSSPFLL